MIENSRHPVTIIRAARTPEGSLSQPLQASFIGEIGAASSLAGAP